MTTGPLYLLAVIGVCVAVWLLAAFIEGSDE